MGELVTSEQAPRLLAIVERLSPHLNGPTAHRLADVLDRSPELDDLSDLGPTDVEWVSDALACVGPADVERWEQELDALSSLGIRVLFVNDPDYPSNVAAVHDRPPLLFVDGELEHEADRRAVAVVGSRSAGARGLELAATLSCELARENVVVVSGLAVGIDGAAHRGALDGGGRTVAVLGTGIRRVYPAAHASLAREVRTNGACVSQFWPNQGPTRWTFPIRNIVTSAFAVATVVVEAGATSGARLQAERALVHGKRVILTRELVVNHAWARGMLEQPAVTIADCVDDILTAVQYELVSPARSLELLV